MSLHFIAAHGYSIDTANAVMICPPRMEPGTASGEVEYQYWIYKNDDMGHGLGCFGSSVLVEEAGQTVRLFTLNLGQPQAIESMLKLKQQFHLDVSDFEFIHRLAEGLVRVFESRTDNAEAVRYVALTVEARLQDIGVTVPADLPRLPSGQVVLAEARVQASSIL
jgi:hypothetical protein